MRASEFQIARLIIAPAIVPFIMAGLRLSVGRGIVGLVVGEFFTAQTGLGGLLGPLRQQLPDGGSIRPNHRPGRRRLRV